MKKILTTSIFILSFVMMSACASPQESANSESTSTLTNTTSTEALGGDNATTELTASLSQIAEEAVVSEPGKIHLDYPIDIKTTAKKGEFVLAPSRAFLDDALKNESSTFIFYNRTMFEPGTRDSRLKELSLEVSMPNSLIIPLPAGEKVKAGDIVLTWWQSGSGMQRAIVLEGGTATEPLVKYLDLGLEVEPEILKPDTFVKLEREMQPGTTVAVKDGEDYIKETVINVSGNKILTTGWAGKMAVRERSQVKSVPIKISLKVGESIFVPVIGNYRKATVKEIDAVNGEIVATYEFGGSPSEEKFPYGDIIKKL